MKTLVLLLASLPLAAQVFPPSGGSASLPATPNILAGDNAGGAAATTLGPSGLLTFNTTTKTLDVDTTLVCVNSLSCTISGLWTFSQGAVLTPLAADPGAPPDGQLWVNSATNLLKWRSGGVTYSAAAATAISPTVAISTLGSIAPGGLGGQGWPTAVANALGGMMLTVGRPFVLGRLGITVQTAGAAGALAAVGVYSADGTTQLCAISVAATTTGAKTATCSGATEPAGTYAVAWTSNDTTVKYYGVAATGGVEDLANAGTLAAFFIPTNTATAGVMPATLGTINKSSIVSPLLVEILPN